MSIVLVVFFFAILLLALALFQVSEGTDQRRRVTTASDAAALAGAQAVGKQLDIYLSTPGASRPVVATLLRAGTGVARNYAQLNGATLTGFSVRSLQYGPAVIRAQVSAGVVTNDRLPTGPDPQIAGTQATSTSEAAVVVTAAPATIAPPGGEMGSTTTTSPPMLEVHLVGPPAN